MRDQLFIEKKYADSFQLESDSQTPENTVPGLRVYKYSPHSVCVQIRCDHKPNPWSKAKPKFSYTGLNLNHSEIGELIDYLAEVREKVA